MRRIPQETFIKFINDYLTQCPKTYDPDGPMNHYYTRALDELLYQHGDTFDYEQFLVDHCEYKVVARKLITDRQLKVETYIKIHDKLLNVDDNDLKRVWIDSCVVSNLLDPRQATDEQKEIIATDICKYGKYSTSTNMLEQWLPQDSKYINEDIYSFCALHMDCFYFISYFIKNEKRRIVNPNKEVFLKFLGRGLTVDNLNAIARIYGKYSVEATNTIINHGYYTDISNLTIDFSTFDDTMYIRFSDCYCSATMPDDIFLALVQNILDGKYTGNDMFSNKSSSWLNVFIVKYYRGVINKDIIDNILNCKHVSNYFKAKVMSNSTLLNQNNWDSVIQFAIVSTWNNVSNSIQNLEMNEASKELCIQEVIKNYPFVAKKLLYDLMSVNSDTFHKYFMDNGYSQDYLDLLAHC